LTIITQSLLILPSFAKYEVSLNTDDEQPKKLSFILDFGNIEVLILSSQLDCDALNSCTWYQKDKKEGTYNGTPYTYRTAYLNLNIPTVDTEKEEDQKFKTLKVYIYIVEGLKNNVMGVNDINAISNYMEYGYELVFNLRKVSLLMQPMAKSDSKQTTLNLKSPNKN
jgi:hypothetical protein